MPLRGVQLRKHPRLSVNFPLTYVVEGDPVQREGSAIDIGGGGMLIQSAQFMAVRSSLTIEFGLRPGLNLQVRGRTVSSFADAANNVYRHRIVFEPLPDEIRDAIVAYVNDGWRAELMRHIWEHVGFTRHATTAAWAKPKRDGSTKSIL
jgi:hypothetical protein